MEEASRLITGKQLILKQNDLHHLLDKLFQKLLRHYGPQHWWPGDSPFEVIVGAILTQSAAWTNVEKGISALKQAGVLSPRALRELPARELSSMIYSCGYYNAKAAKLKAFAQWLGDNYQDSLEKLFSGPAPAIRIQLLSVHGIGEETADSILLYAGNKPVFVIDAYTRRIIDRLEYSPRGREYCDYQKMFMDNLTPDAGIFNEYHALLVAQGKNTCRKKPLCQDCCLRDICPSGSC